MNVIRRVLGSSMTPFLRQPINQSFMTLGIGGLNNLGLGKLTQTILGSSIISPTQTHNLHTKCKKQRKLHPSLRHPENGGLDYGVDIFKAYAVKRQPKPYIKKNPLGPGVPMAKGISIVLKTLVKKPKKPNSANRKCVLIRLPSGKEYTAYIPGEGHSLQEHNQVAVRNKRLRDTPGVKLTCMRGMYDLPHVVKKTN